MLNIVRVDLTWGIDSNDTIGRTMHRVYSKDYMAEPTPSYTAFTYGPEYNVLAQPRTLWEVVKLHAPGATLTKDNLCRPIRVKIYGNASHPILIEGH